MAQPNEPTVLRPRKELLLEKRLRLLGRFLREIASVLIGNISVDCILDGRDDRLRGLHRVGRFLN